MMKSKSRIIGFIVLALVIGVVIAFTLNKPKPTLTVNGYLGGEKIGLFEDPEFKKIMAEKHNLTLNYKKAGSIDMVHADKNGMNYLFPASQTGLELYKSQVGSPKKAETAFNTPLVIYTHVKVKDQLMKQGYVTESNGSWHMNMKKFAEDAIKGKTWADLGLPELYGSMSIRTTDPTKSNSGNMFAGLIANSLNGGVVKNQDELNKVMPQVKLFFTKMGFMDTSSSDLFNQFLNMGMGAYPMIAAYENQILEFAVNNPDDWNQIKDDIVIIYPGPTVYAAHPIIALDDDGVKAVDAMMDPAVQDLAWRRHGFRTGVSSKQDQTIFGVTGVISQVTHVAPLPNYQLMEKLIKELE